MGRAQILFSNLSPCPPLHVLLSHLASPGKEEETFPLETSVKFFTHDARQNVFVSIAIVIKTTEERGGETTNKWKKNFVLAVKLSLWSPTYGRLPSFSLLKGVSLLHAQ